MEDFLSRAMTGDENTTAARAKFQNLMKKLKEVQESRQRSESKRHCLISDEELEDDNQPNGKRRGKGAPPLKKRKGQNSRKSESPQTLQSNSSQPIPNVFNLFDRKVDVAGYEVTTSLYPLCRAWIHNDLKEQVRLRKEKEERKQNEPEVESNIYENIPPLPLPLDAFGNEIKLRIPAPLPRDNSDAPFDVNYSEDDAPSPAFIFSEHLDRWRLIRQRWKAAYAYNELRFKASLANLKQNHDDTNCPSDLPQDEVQDNLNVKM